MKRYMRFIAVAFAFAAQACFVADAQKRPNIIWLMSEDIGPDLECYGMKAVRTPNLNSLAEGGIRYTNCFASNPICSPNRSAMMVGVHQNKINAGNHRSNHDLVLPEPYKPFTYWLRQAGYTTVLGNSKVMDRGRKTDLNFKYTPLGSWDGKKNLGLFDKFDELPEKGQPFFAQIQLAVTHRGDWWDSIRSISPHPVDPDKVELPSYLSDHPVIRTDWAKYLDQIEYMDREVGILIEDLKRTGVYDNTVIIFIGDNGRCHIKGKGYLYDPGIHIPLIIHWPDGIEPRQVKTGLVSAVDITATILDLAGIKIPEYMDGRSLMNKDFHRDYVYSARDRWDDVPERSRSVTTQKFKYIRNYMTEVPYDDHQAYLEFYRPALHVMRKLHLDNKLTDNQKQFFVQVKPEEELYDLENDPEELNNLISSAEFSSVLSKMREQLSREEKRDTPAKIIHHAAPSQASVILDWVRYNYPNDYLQMLEGKEIGYQKFSRMYTNRHKKDRDEK